MALGHAVSYTFREYLAHEAVSNTKHEYLAGQIYAMAGGSPEHSALIASITTHLSNLVRGGPCRVHMSGLRIRVTETGLATYPDVAVVCGAWQRDPEDANTILNPTLIVEVLSPSTEAYDRGEKLDHYKSIPSLRACLLFAHDRREVEMWLRDAGRPWQRTLAGPGAELEVTALSLVLKLDSVYDDAAEPKGA